MPRVFGVAGPQRCVAGAARSGAAQALGCTTQDRHRAWRYRGCVPRGKAASMQHPCKCEARGALRRAKRPCPPHLLLVSRWTAASSRRSKRHASRSILTCPVLNISAMAAPT